MSSQQDSGSSNQLSAGRRPLTSAEKQRNYRERLKQSPERFKLFKQREAERQRERVRTRKQTEEQIANQRMKWRERVRKHRLKKKQETLMNETQFQDQRSEDITNNSVMPHVFSGSEELPIGMNFNQSSYNDVEYSQANSCPNMNIGQYIMDAHNNGSRDESGNSVVKLECNTPERNDDSTHEINVEAGNHFLIQQNVHATSENKFRVTPCSEVNDDGNPAILDQIPYQQQMGRTASSPIDRFHGDSPKKRKPLTPAREPSAERKKKVKEGSCTRSGLQKTGQVNGFLLPATSSYAEDFSVVRSTEESRTATDCTQSNTDSRLDMSLYGVKLEQDDLDGHGTGNIESCEDNMLDFTADACSNNYTNSTVEGDSLCAEKFIEVTNESGYDFGQSPINVGRSPTNVEDMQGHKLTSSSELQQKKWPLTPAEKQRNYRERLKLSPERFKLFKQREAERQRERVRTRKQTEEQIANQRMKWRERVRKHRLKKKQEALMNETQFQDQRSEDITNNSVMPHVFSGSEELPIGMNFNQSSYNDVEYSQANSCPNMNIGQYITDAHNNGSRGKSGNSVVKLECNTLERNDDSTCEINIEAGNHFLIQQNVHTTSENKFRVTPYSEVNDDGNQAIRDQIPYEQQMDRTASSPTDMFHGDSPKRRKPLTPAERQRNYRARLKAQPGKWEEYRAKDADRRRKMREPSTQPKRRVKEGSCTRSGLRTRSGLQETGQVNGVFLPATSSYAEDFSVVRSTEEARRATDCTQSNTDSHLDMSLYGVKLEQDDLDGHGTGNMESCEDNMLDLTPDACNNNCTNSTVEGGTSFYAGEFIEVTNGVEQSPVDVGRSLTNVEDMQGHTLSSSSEPQQKKWPTEIKREHRHRLKDSQTYLSTSSAKVVTLINHLNQNNCSSFPNDEANTDSQVGMNLSELKLQQCGFDKDDNNGAKCMNNMVHVKLESITTDTSDNWRNVSLEVRDYGHGSVSKDGNPAAVEEMQSPLPEVLTVLSPVRDSSGRLQQKWPLTPAERQRNYRARRKAQQEMMQQQQHQEGLSVLSLVGDLHGQLPQKKWPLTPAERQRNYRARRKANLELMEKQKKMSEEASTLQRKKVAERKKDYRYHNRKKDSVLLPSTSSTETLPLIGNDVVNVKHESIPSDTCTNDKHINLSLEVVDYSRAETYGILTSKIGHDAEVKDGNPANVEDMQTPLLEGPSVLVEGSSGRLPQKKWPMTPAERQRKYRARRKAKQEMVQKQPEEAVSMRRRKATERQTEYQRRLKDSQTYPSTSSSKVLNQLNQNNCSSFHSDETNTDSQVGMNLSKLKLQQCDFDKDAKSEAKCMNNMVLVKLESITPDASDEYTNVSLEVRDFSHGYVSKDGTPAAEEIMQTRLPEVPSVLSQSGSSSGRLQQKKCPMTPAERQRKYKARLKAKQEMMHKQSEEASSLRRRKATEGKREYRRRLNQNDCKSFPSDEAKADSQVGMNLSELNLQQCDFDKDANNGAKCVKLESITTDTSDNWRNVSLEVRDYGHDSAFKDGNPANVEEMQSPLPEGPSVSSLVGDSSGRLKQKKCPMTPAERQRKYKARLKAKQEMMQKQSGEAASFQRRKATERKGEYLCRKKDSENFPSTSSTKVLSNNGVINVKSSERRSPSEKRSPTEKRARDKIRATELNQNRYRVTEFMQTNTNSYFDMNSAELKEDQYVLDTTLNFESECNPPDGDGNSTHEMNKDKGNCFPEHQSVQATIENEGRGLGQVLTRSSGSSVVVSVQRRPRRRRPMNPAERQRKYRARLKAKAEQTVPQRLRDTEKRRNIQEQTQISEDTASQLTKMSKESRDQPEKRDMEELDNHGKHCNAEKSDMCSIPLDSLRIKTTKNSIAARRQPNRSIKNQPTIGVVIMTEQRDDGRCSSTERHEPQTEDKIAYKQMKGRKRMRKFCLQQKQILANADLGVSESNMPKITSEWSVSERDQLRAHVEQSPQESTQYLPGYFGNAAPVCSLSNMPNTNTRMTHNLSTTFLQQDMGTSYGFDSSPGTMHSVGNANTLENSDIPTAIASQTSQLNHSEEDQERGTFQENEIPFRTRRMTSAERQRRYRERLQQSPEKWAAYKQKATERYLARKELTTIQQVMKHRKQSLVRTRQWRASVKENKNSKDITLNDALQDGISEEETPTTHLPFPAENDKHLNISEKFDGLKGVKSMVQSGNRRCSKSPEEMERLRQANREKQRRYRARKRGDFEKSMPCISSFALNTNQPEFANLSVVDGVEISQRSENSTQFRICPNISSSEHESPRKWEWPRLPTQFIEQPTPHGRKKRTGPPKTSPLSTEQPMDADTIVSPLGGECPGEVLVSSAGNIPMVIRTLEVKGERDIGWQEIPQMIPCVIPCDPPEVDFDWGNVELDHFQPDLDEVAPMVKVEVSDPVPGEVEGGNVSGSARRKAFLPTRHNTAALTLNAEW